MAQLIAVYVNSQKTKPPYYSAKDFLLFAPEIESGYSPDTANTFLSLSRENKLPPWAIAIAPVEEIRKAANDQPPRYPRALTCRGLILICPAIGLESVRSELVLADDDCPSGTVMMWDLDTGESFSLLVEGVPEGEVELRLV